MKKILLAILITAVWVAALGQDDLQVINTLRNVLRETSITDSQRNFFNAVLAMSLKNSGRGGAESDSLIDASWKAEMKMPLEKQSYFTYQTIAGYHILSANKKGVADAVRMAEKTFRNDGGKMDSTWFAHKSFLLTGYRYIENLSGARRMVEEDIRKIADNTGLHPSKSLLEYLWNCYRFIESENSHESAMKLYCFSLITKYTQEYLADVGVENVELSLYTPMFTILSKPSYASHVDMDEIIDLMNQADSMIAQRHHLSQSDRIAYAQFLVNKSRYLLRGNGDIAKAEDAAKRALTIACNDWDKIRAYGALIAVYTEKKDFDKIPEIYTELSRLAKSLGIEDYTFNNVEAMYDMAVSLRYNDEDKALAAAQRSFDIFRNEWDSSLPFMTTADRENFLSKNGDPVAAFLILLDRCPEKVVARLYNGILYRTGMQLRAQKETRMAIEESKNPEVRALNDTLQNLRIVYRKMDDLDEDAMALNMRIKSLERKIMDIVGKGNLKISQTPKWDEVRDCLKENEAAIEFVFSVSKLYALIVRKGMNAPVPVALTSNTGLVNYMNSHMGKNTVATARKMYKDNSGSDGLYQLLWEPMTENLKDVDRIYLSVPGALNSISFNAIVTPNGTTLFDEYEIRRVTTTGNLTEKKRNGAPGETLMLGDVNFSSESSVSENNTDGGERGAARHYFSLLPFAALEIDSIHNVMSSKKVSILAGTDASEANLRKEMGNIPDVIHLATHGFFIADVRDALKVPYMKRHAMSVNSSMQRAGVALAGAERSWSGKDAVTDNNDGILTALEVAEMNLRGVRLVTLSACETALGNFSFEGVYGLPRGFKQAGVESMLVSLWSVNDKATSEFMTEFYRNWKKTKERHSAYRMAMKKIREKYPEPFYWASFIMLD